MKRSGKKKTEAPAPNKASTSAPAKPPGAGMPAQDSILSEKVFKSPKGKVYRIIKTNEMDAYDKPKRLKDR